MRVNAFAEDLILRGMRTCASRTTKASEMSMSIPVIEQAKIQAQVLVPLIKAMQAELGEARANALVRKALGGDLSSPWGRILARETRGEFGEQPDVSLRAVRPWRCHRLSRTRAIARRLRYRCYRLPLRAIL